MKRSRSNLFNLVWRVEAERKNKRGLSADGVGSLAPSALRPRLFGVLFVAGCTVLTASAVGQVLFAEKVEAASLTLTVPDNLSLSISPESTSTFKESSPVNLVVKTDAYSGYTLNIKSKDNTNTLKNSSVSGSVLNSITSEMSAATFQSSGTNNTWGFKSSKYKGSSNDNYQPGPTSDVLLEKTGGANNTSGVTYNLSIAAKVDGSIAYGTYKNTFTITATANPVPYTFSYNSNGGSSAPSTQSGTGSEGSTKNLTTSTPSKSGYTFQGWCTVNPGTSESCPSSGTKYSSGAAYTLTNSSNEVTFYAIWKATGNTMQNWSGCSSLSQHQTVTLTDSRDNNTYTVAKLKDGKCWMTQNLRIVGRTINSTNSDMSSGSYTIPNTESSFGSTNIAGAFYRSDTNEGYYNWFAATTGSTLTSGNAPNSICPKGWKLPSKEQLSALGQFYDANSILASPVNYSVKGAYSRSTFTMAGCTTGFGDIWSSTANNNDAYHTEHCNGAISFNDCDSKFNWGWNVRCIFK